MTPRIAVTPGEPAGVGPELLVQLAQHQHGAELVAVADPQLLQQRAAMLKLPLTLEPFDARQQPTPSAPGTLKVLSQHLAAPAQAGKLSPANANYVLDCLRSATDACLSGDCDALLTGPVQKSVINDAGIPFSGHTEFLAERCGVEKVVMMLASERMRVALVTTHIPLSAVPVAITNDELERTLRILHSELRQRFGIDQPRIMVLGLNPHAGEGGHMGREEIEVITPCLARMQDQGMHLIGPLPADTAFTPKHLDNCDAVLAMYHDQGLPVLKYQSFGQGINITLGLPIIRSSVDHGTALDLAGTGRADPGSMLTALNAAITMAKHSRN